jgi:hypothetical protein
MSFRSANVECKGSQTSKVETKVASDAIEDRKRSNG